MAAARRFAVRVTPNTVFGNASCPVAWLSTGASEPLAHTDAENVTLVAAARLTHAAHRLRLLRHMRPDGDPHVASRSHPRVRCRSTPLGISHLHALRRLR